MQVIYAGEAAPESFSKSIFLAGPTPRQSPALAIESWRPKMLEALEKAGYDGVVFVPESRDGVWLTDYMGQIEWEQSSMNMSDIVLMWVPREMHNMPALTTNIEFGMLVNSGKLFYGRPDGSPHTAYLDYMYHKITHSYPHKNIDELAQEVSDILKEGISRTGGERCIPRHIWTTKHFQDWLKQLKAVGNRLDDAKVLWNFLLKNNFPFCFSIWVNVWVEAEQRHKENEIIVSRTDISSICAYYKGEGRVGEAEDWLDTEILLVREFRSPNRTIDGFVHELPSGSSFGNDNPREVAAQELEEETGISISPNRFVEAKSRQLAGTFSTHKATLFTVELTKMEITAAKMNAGLGEVHGNNVTDSEQTYLEVRTVHEILESNLCDWTTVGMIMEAIR
ncbi:MAG: NUDIX domain-containing protein [Proteobacteria bacterium]|jgi:8-oxo-dGTP pyrophosphatase MutT (NUDIX family)|nr:NUDIX domain-containing protein [Pseudomonadota bacterium]